jgi:hypothetical protein
MSIPPKLGMCVKHSHLMWLSSNCHTAKTKTPSYSDDSHGSVIVA